MLNRPPPYFPQSQLSPPDSKRYLKFKIVLVFIGILLLLGISGLGIGIYYLISWMTK